MFQQLRGAVPAEVLCLRGEVEKKSRKKPGTYLLLGISPCIGIGSILEPAGSDVWWLNFKVKVSRMGDTGDRRGSPMIAVSDGYPHSSGGIHQAMTQSAKTLPAHSFNNKFHLIVHFKIYCIYFLSLPYPKTSSTLFARIVTLLQLFSKHMHCMAFCPLDSISYCIYKVLLGSKLTWLKVFKHPKAIGMIGLWGK